MFALKTFNSLCYVHLQFGDLLCLGRFYAHLAKFLSLPCGIGTWAVEPYLNAECLVGSRFEEEVEMCLIAYLSALKGQQSLGRFIQSTEAKILIADDVVVLHIHSHAVVPDIP